MPSIDKEELAEAYGWALSLLKSDKGLWNTFNSAVKGNWSPERFQAKLRNTSWWKKHADSWKQWQLLSKTNPGEANARVGRLSAELGDLATQMGARITGSQRNRIASNALQLGWSDAQIRNTLSQYVTLYKTRYGSQYGGEAEKNYRTITKMLERNVPWTWGGWGKAIQSWVKGIAAGSNSLDTVEGYIRDYARKIYPAYSEQINAGVDVADLAGPFVDSMSQILELSPGDLSLRDPTIRKAMQYKDPTSKKPAEMEMWRFEETLRRDNRWKKTSNSQDQVMATANGLLQKFGLISG